MSYPNPNLGSFEGENGAWSEHVTTYFLQEVTSPQVASPGCDPAHAAVAHMSGAMMCAILDDFSPDLVEKLRYLFKTIIEDQNFTLHFPEEIRPHLTVLPGGKEE
jgi:hypothetical protein